MRLALLFALLVPSVPLAQPADAPEAAQVLVLGTYHFDNPGLDVAQFEIADVLHPTRQAEVHAIVESLADFRPTKVVVEYPWDGAETLDSLYAAYRAGTHALDRSEVEQLGFRLADRFGHERIIGGDHRGAFLLDPLVAYDEAHDATYRPAFMRTVETVVAEMDSLQRTATIGDNLRHFNTPEALRRDLGLYVGAAGIGAGDGFVGAEFASAWYERNIRIFATVAAETDPGDRVLVIFGVSHAPILRHLIEMAPGMRLVETEAFLPPEASGAGG